MKTNQAKAIQLEVDLLKKVDQNDINIFFKWHRKWVLHLNSSHMLPLYTVYTVKRITACPVSDHTADKWSVMSCN